MAAMLAVVGGATSCRESKSARQDAASPKNLPMERSAWEKYQPLGGEFEGGRYIQRHDSAPSFELSRTVPPSSNIVVEAVVIPERAAEGASSGTMGIVVWEGHFRWRRLGLTFGKGGRHSFELIELRDGARMPESDLPAEPAGGAWNFGEPVTLRLSLGYGAVEGEARDATGTLLFHRRLPIKTGAVTSGIPGFSLYRLHASFDSFTASIGAPLPDTRDEPREYRQFFGRAERVDRAEAPRYFSTTRDANGKWWFVDPAGNRMFLSGVGVVNYRGHYSAALGYAPYYRTVQTKYPTLDDWATNTLRRVGEWGFNFLSSPSENLLRRGFPHASVVNHGMGQNFACYGDEFDILPCDGGPCSGFPNVFHPLWPEYCRFAAQSFCRAEREDQWLLGWYTDNELSWWGDKRQFKTPPESGLFDAAARKAPGHPAREALEAFLADHGSFGAASAAPAELKREFVRLCARKYFEATTAAIREADPNHLILGCRFAGLPSADPVVWEECGRFCDAVSVNIYPMADLDRGVAVDWPGPKARLMSDLIGERARMAGKPVIVTEWSFSALDSGLPCTHGAGQRFFTQKERAEATSIFSRTMWAMPEVGGYVYFMWCDQPAVGKSGPQSENTNYGLVNADDEPYEEQVAALAALQLNPAASRAANVPQPREVIPPKAEDFATNAARNTPPGPFGATPLSEGGNANIGSPPPRGGCREATGGVLRMDQCSFLVSGKGVFSAMLREYSRGGVWWTAATEAVEAGRTPAEVSDTRDVEVSDTRDIVFCGAASSGPFEVAMRFYEPSGRDFFIAELLSVRNGADKPLPFDAVFFRVMPLDREGAEAARGDDVFEPPKGGQPTPIPPMLWRPWRSGAWILPDGTALGLLSPRQTGVQIRFWKDDNFHADAEMRYPRRTLEPGETWAPESRPFVIGGAASGGEVGWRDFCNEIKTLL